jgi:hypothetical protein
MIQALVVTKNTGIDNPKPKIRLTDQAAPGRLAARTPGRPAIRTP